MHRVAAFRDARDLLQFHDLKDEALSLLIEAGELAERLRWRDDDALRARIADDPDPVVDELADVLCWTLLLAHDLGVDVEVAFERKMRPNEREYPLEKASGRPDQHDALSRLDIRSKVAPGRSWVRARESWAP